MDKLDLTAFKKKASCEEIMVYVLENVGLKVNNLNIAQEKRMCGIVERENYNKAKSEVARQHNCPENKEKAI